MADLFIDKARKTMEAKGTVESFKNNMKKQSMVKPINSGASLASGLQQQSMNQFKKSKNLSKGKR
jgi:hypothetical protein